MNRTFKVAKSLTRGVVVTSEKASSYQGKAVKTVVAAAVALIATGAFAAAADVTLNGENIEVKADQEVVVTSNTTTADKNDVTITVSGGKITLNNVQNTADNHGAKLLVSGGDVIVKAGTANNFQNMAITGGTLTIDGGDTAGGAWRSTTNVGGYAGKDEDGNRSTLISNATVKINNGMLWGGAQSAEDEIRKASPLIIKNSKVELSGKTVDQSGILYTGTGKPMQIAGSTVTVAKDQFGAIFTPELTVENSTITNAGTLNIAFSIGSNNETVSGSLDSAEAANSAITLGQGTTFNTAETGTTNITAKLTVDGAAVTNAGTLNTKTVTIKSGKIENAGEGVFSADKISIEGNGVLNTTYTTDTFKWKEITVADNGVLNLDALNSRHDGQKIGKDKDGNVLAGDRLLINAGTINLAGGELQVAGTKYEGDLKIGRSDTNAKVTVTSDYSFNKVEFGSSNKITGDNTASTLTIGSKDKAGKLTIADLDLSNGDVTVKGGSTLNITDISAIGESAKLTNAGTVNITGTVKTTQTTLTDTNFDNTGSIYTGLENLVALTYNSDKTEISNATITAFGSALNGDSGNVFDTTDRTLKLDEYNKIATAMGKLTMLNTVVTSNTAGEDLKFSDVASTGLNSPSTTVVAEAATSEAKSVDVAVANDKSVVVSNVEANYETVNVNGQGTLQLAGNDGVLFGEDVKTVKVTNGGLVLGHEQFAAKTGEIVGEVNIDQNSTVTVEAGTFAVGGLAGNGTVNVEDGGFTTNYASAEGTINVNGGVAAVLGNKPVTTATAAAGEEGAEEEPTPFDGAVKVGTVTFGATSTTTLALTPVEPTESDGIFAVGVDAATAAAVVAANYDNLDGKKVVYLTKQVEFTAAPAAATDYLVDLGKVAATEHFSAEDGVMNNELGSNVQSIKLINLDAAALSGKSGEKVLQFSQKTNGSTATVDVDFGNWFYGSYYDQYDGINPTGFSAASGQITFKPNEYVVDHVQDMNLGQAAIQAADDVVWGQNEIVDAIGFGTVAYAKVLKDSDTYKALVQQDANNQTAGKTTHLAQDYLDGMMDTYLDQLDIASELAIAGGVFGTTLDINDQVTAALDRRTSLANLNAPRTAGFTPWVDVFGTKNEAKRIYGEGAGYEADIYGAVLGFDYTAACGGVLGLAFNVGQADGNSVGIGSAKVENDADFYGVSLYAAQTFGDFNVKADLGYTQVKNDLKMNGVTKTWKESQDADVITFGVGTEFLVKAGALNVVPHAGIRMTRIDLDDSKYGAEYETMTVYQMPLGVAFSGTFDTNGWKVAPMVDLSVVPTFGDKDAEAKYFGGVKDVVRVVDSNPIRATLGVEAQTGAWTFGVNYGLTAGSDDRLNNSLNANARYTF